MTTNRSGHERLSRPPSAAIFSITRTTVDYSWEHHERDCQGGITGLTLVARPGGAVRGIIHRRATFPLRLHIVDWQLLGPADLGADWTVRTNHALRQLHRRVQRRPHATPEQGGHWHVSVHERLRISHAPDTPSKLATAWPFTPEEMFIDVSTNGSGSILLFGHEPMEMNSTRFDFAVGLNGLVAFDQLDSDDEVPSWAREPTIEATRRAFDLRAAAAQLLIDEATGARA